MPADSLGLPDPADYAAPMNAGWERPLIHPSGQKPSAGHAEDAPEPADDSLPPAAPEALVNTDSFPPDPPTITGDQITESVFQGGDSP
jgi:hypothetical protein